MTITAKQSEQDKQPYKPEQYQQSSDKLAPIMKGYKAVWPT
jgi:hypothetical protein